LTQDVLEVTSISLSEVVRRLSASRRLVPISAGVGLVIGVLLWAVLPRTYVSEATLLPSTGDEASMGGSNLLSIAGSLGFNLPGAAAPESHLFPTILKSERIIRNALGTSINAADPSQGTLYDIVRNDGAPENVRMELAAERVRHELLRIGLDEETGVVRVTVRMSDPILANRTAEIFLNELSEYLRRERTAQARENRVFVESRRADAGERLSVMEENLRAFRETNRKLSNSPDLLLEQERLIRDLRIQEEVFLELTRQYELARIEEQKATPILEILDPPTIHYAPRNPKLPIFGGVGLLAGLFLGSLIAVVFESPRNAAAGALAGAQSLLGFRG
jgi:uncharacterized protein involved in exopolysaccharide biosynthesis